MSLSEIRASGLVNTQFDKTDFIYIYIYIYIYTPGVSEYTSLSAATHAMQLLWLVDALSVSIINTCFWLSKCTI